VQSVSLSLGGCVGATARHPRKSVHARRMRTVSTNRRSRWSKLRSTHHTSSGYGMKKPRSFAIDQGAGTILSYAVDPAAFRTRHGGDLISPPKGPPGPDASRQFHGCFSTRGGPLSAGPAVIGALRCSAAAESVQSVRRTCLAPSPDRSNRAPGSRHITDSTIAALLTVRPHRAPTHDRSSARRAVAPKPKGLS